MKFREHRGSLSESMETVIEIEPTKEALALAVDAWRRRLGMPLTVIPQVTSANVDVMPYGGRDERIGWETHLVTIKGWGPVGFTDGPLSGLSETSDLSGISAKANLAPRTLAVRSAAASYAIAMATLDTQCQAISVRDCEPLASQVKRRWVEFLERLQFNELLPLGCPWVTYDAAGKSFVVHFEGEEELERLLRGS
jgi:hypothetical protein